MAKEKKKKQSEAVKLQKLANKTAVEIQNMVNSANQLQMEYNKNEAEISRKFNADEAAKVRAYNTSEAAIAREFNEKEANTARTFNAEEAQKARDWQTEMSNTAHQREVEDLKKAGLNPVLSVNNGAQSYTTSSANAGAASSSAASGSNASGSAASGNFESGAAIFGSLMSGLMSSMSALKQTQMQNDSALRVANINAAANKYATDVSANTARYVANTNLEASKYSADMGYKTQMEKPVTNLFGLADKYLGKGVFEAASKLFDYYFPNGLTLDEHGNLPYKDGKNLMKIEKLLGIADYSYEFGQKYSYPAWYRKLNAIFRKGKSSDLFDIAKHSKNKGHRYTGMQE